MKNLYRDQIIFFKGAGLILGFVVSIVGFLVVFSITDAFVAAISAAIPIGVFSGIGLEQKFQRNKENTNSRKTKMMLASFLFGFIIFVVFYIVLQLL